MLLSSDGVLKLGDFGLARVHDESKASDYTHQVATRCGTVVTWDAGTG